MSHRPPFKGLIQKRNDETPHAGPPASSRYDDFAKSTLFRPRCFYENARTAACPVAEVLFSRCNPIGMLVHFCRGMLIHSSRATTCRGSSVLWPGRPRRPRPRARRQDRRWAAGRPRFPVRRPGAGHPHPSPPDRPRRAATAARHPGVVARRGGSVLDQAGRLAAPTRAPRPCGRQRSAISPRGTVNLR